MFTKSFFFVITLSTLCYSNLVLGDGNNVDKVYHPYVLPLETEIEWRTIYQNDDDPALDNQYTNRLAFGKSLFEYWFTEIYLIGQKSANKDFKVNAVEIEAKRQLTEQGEYSADWGLLFEYERNYDINTTELAAALLIEKEWGRWVGALNTFIEFEQRETMRSEIESSLATQLRYRYSRHFEPALELYKNQDTLAFGPVIMGNIRMGIAKKLHWEFGVIYGLDNTTPDETARALLEYEF